MSNQNNTFEKPPLSIDDQLERLSSRGVIMQDKDTARHTYPISVTIVFVGMP